MPKFDIPRFNSKDDPELWLYRYDKAAQMNEWDEKVKLNYVDNAFEESLQLWFMRKNFKAWNEFKAAFLSKHAKKVDLSKVIADPTNIKMLPNESVTSYIERFEKKKGLYDNEITKRKLILSKNKYDPKGKNKIKASSSTKDTVDVTANETASPKDSTSTTAKEGDDFDTMIELIITEAGFVKCFTKGLSSKTLKRDIKARRFSNLEDILDWLRDIYESDDSDTSASTDEEHKEEPRIVQDKLVPAKTTQPLVTAATAKDDAFTNAMNSLSHDFKNMTLLLGEMNLKLSNSNQVLKKRNTSCFNCGGEDHYSNVCSAPCKLCNSTDHRHYQCSLYKNNAGGTNMRQALNQSNPSHHNENMLIEEEMLLSEKRKHEEAMSEAGPSTVKKRAPLMTRSGLAYGATPQSQGNAPQISVPEPAKQPIILSQDPVKPSQKAISKRPIQSQPEHPLRPLEQPGDKAKLAQSKLEGIIHKVLNEPVHNMSVSDIAEISSASRSLIKSAITKPQVNKRPRKKAQPEDVTMLLNEPVKGVPKGKSAPRAYARINDVSCEVILDGGCTTFIIGLAFAKKIGIQQLEPSDVACLFGDGVARQAVGIAKNVAVQVGASYRILVNALCYDVGDRYDFIVGREGLHALRIGTDWYKHYWYISNDEGVIPLEVHYTKDHQRIKIDSDASDDYPESDVSFDSEEEQYVDQDDYEEGYLIMEDYDEAPMEYGPERPPEDCLGRLVEDVAANKDLTAAEKKELTRILREFRDCFGTSYDHLSTTNLVKFHVDTGDAKPIFRKPYAMMSNSEKATLKKDLEEMVSNGILVPNTYIPGNSRTSGWSFPVRYVPKKNGEKRLVTNFRPLNDVTIRDPWPMPSMVDVIEELAGAKWFVNADLLKAFQQIAVENSSIQKLTISTPFGAYSYKCMPFGVVNGPACFSRCVYLAIQPFLGRFATNFYDDCVLYAKDKEHLMNHVKEFLGRLREVNLKLNATKCEFFKQEIVLLGFVVNERGVSPLPSKVQKIKDFPRPVNTTHIRAFINLCGFYRRHIPAFADMAAPLNDLLKKSVKFVWSDDCEQAFTDLKEALMGAVTLVIPGPETKYNLYTDASDIGIGACLSTVDEQGTEKPVLFLSRKLQSAELRYPTVEKELLAVVYALRKLRKYLLDNQFTLYCDNTAVVYMFNKDEPSQRLQRWVLCTQEYTFKMVHLPSRKNAVADALSRFPTTNGDAESNGEEDIEAMFDHMLAQEVDDYEGWLLDLLFYFKNPGNSRTTPKIKRLSFKYYYQDDRLYRKVGVRLLRVPPIHERNAILHQIHEGHGHFGIHASWARLYYDYWWPRAYTDLKEHVLSCVPCQLYSPIQCNPTTIAVPTCYLFEKFALDFVGPLPTTPRGNTYLLVAVEMFTRWPIAVPTKSMEAKEVSNLLYNHIFCVYGMPTHILTDNGASFDNDIIDQLLSLVSVHHQFTSPYRPSTNGRTEQMNGNLVKAMKKICMSHATTWDTNVNSILYAYRTKVHSTLKISPFESLYGIPPQSASQDAIQMMGRALGMERSNRLQDINIQIEDYNILHEDQLEYENKKIIRRKYFPPGTKVVRVRFNKLSKMDSNYKPEVFTVVASFNNGTCQLADKAGRQLKRRVNVASLRVFNERGH